MEQWRRNEGENRVEVAHTYVYIYIIKKRKERGIKEEIWSIKMGPKIKIQKIGKQIESTPQNPF